MQLKSWLKIKRSLLGMRKFRDEVPGMWREFHKRGTAPKKTLSLFSTTLHSQRTHSQRSLWKWSQYLGRFQVVVHCSLYNIQGPAHIEVKGSFASEHQPDSHSKPRVECSFLLRDTVCPPMDSQIETWHCAPGCQLFKKVIRPILTLKSTCGCCSGPFDTFELTSKAALCSKHGRSLICKLPEHGWWQLDSFCLAGIAVDSPLWDFPPSIVGRSSIFGEMYMFKYIHLNKNGQTLALDLMH